MLQTEDPFIQEKTGYYQQHVEQLNAQLRDLITKVSGPKQAVLLTCEFLSCMKEIKNLYHRPQGQVLAMGSDECQALGVKNSADEDGLMDYPPTFTIGLPSDVIQVSAGGIHSVALTNSGRVYTWGTNDERALGRDVTEDDAVFVGEIERFPAFAQRRIVQVAAGDNHTVFLTIDGRVLACGTYKDHDSGKFFFPLPGEPMVNGMNQPYPVEIPFPEPVLKIAAGHNVDAAILKSRSLYTWGMGHVGELARSKSMGAPIKRNEFGQMAPDLRRDFVGEEYTVEKRDEDGELKKETKYRYHTDLILREFLTPAPAEFQTRGTHEVMDVAVGEVHILVVARADGIKRAYSSGHNNYGQLGHGDRLQRHELTPVQSLDGESITQVAAGNFHSMFLGITGKCIWACGRSDYGQLGLLETKEKEAGGYKDIPELVPFPYEVGQVRFVDIQAGGSHSAAILENKDVYTWGFNSNAQTGHPTKVVNASEDVERPKHLNPMRYYKSKDKSRGTTADTFDVSCGGQHTLMVVKPYK